MTKKTGDIIAFLATILLDILAIIMVFVSILTPFPISRMPLYVLVTIVLTFFSIKCYKNAFNKKND